MAKSTKGDLVLRDIDLLQRISEVFAAVSFSITTADDALARKLDKHFAGMRQRYIKAFGNDYFAPASHYRQLEAHFKDLFSRYGIPILMPQYEPFTAEQISLF